MIFFFFFDIVWFHIRRCSSLDSTYLLHYRSEFNVLWNRILKVLIQVEWAELSYPVGQVMVSALSSGVTAFGL